MSVRLRDCIDSIAIRESEKRLYRGIPGELECADGCGQPLYREMLVHVVDGKPVCHRCFPKLDERSETVCPDGPSYSIGGVR